MYKNRSQENLAAIFGISANTVRRWVQEFNRSRLESVLKNFNMDMLPEGEELNLEDFDRAELRKMLIRQAQAGSTAATKILLDMKEEEKEPEEQELTVDQAVFLLRKWGGPRTCSKCGHEDTLTVEDVNTGKILEFDLQALENKYKDDPQFAGECRDTGTTLLQ
jgi:transposase-like protein